MELSEIVKQIDKAGSGFDSVIDEAQKRMLKEVINLTKDLKTSNGQILPSVENLKLISKIKGALTKAVVNKDYKAGVSDLIKSFDTIQAEQLNYLNSISNKAPELQKYKLVKEMAIDNTVSQLTESGIDANVTSKLKDMLTRAVTTNANYSDLLGEVREFLTDTDKSAGALSKYAKTYTNTALSQYVGQNNQLITEGSGAEWFRYVGSDIKTTREWCDKMTDKEWVHISEFPEILKGHIDGHKCEIYDKTKLPKGMIEGTTVANLAVNCGGWNCKHNMYPVMTLQVPKNLRDKFEKQQPKLQYTDKQIENAKREYYNMLKPHTLADYEVNVIGKDVAYQRMEYHNKIVREIKGGNKELEKEWKTFFLKQEVKADQKRLESKTKLEANKTASADILAPIKSLKKIGDYGKWLNTVGNKYRKENFNKKYTKESVDAFLAQL